MNTVELNFAKNLSDTHDPHEAARAAFPSADEASVQHLAYRYNQSPAVQGFLHGALDTAKLSVDRCVKKIASKLNARVPYSYGKDSLIYVQDHKTQLKAAELGLKLHNAFPKDTPQTYSPTMVMVNTDERTIERLENVMQMFSTSEGQSGKPPKHIGGTIEAE